MTEQQTNKKGTPFSNRSIDYNIELIESDMIDLFNHFKYMYLEPTYAELNSYLASGIIINGTDYKYVVSDTSLTIDFCYGSCGPQRLMIAIGKHCNVSLVLLSSYNVNTYHSISHSISFNPTQCDRLDACSIIKYTGIIPSEKFNISSKPEQQSVKCEMAQYCTEKFSHNSSNKHVVNLIKNGLFKEILDKMYYDGLFNDKIYFSPYDREKYDFKKHEALLDKNNDKHID